MAIFSTAVCAQVPTGLPKAPAGMPTTGTMSATTTMTIDSTQAMTAPAGSGAAPVATADTAAAKLDAAVAASSKGDKAAAASALNAGVAAAEAQAATSKGDFKEKLMSQAGNLKKLIPGVSSGLVGGNVLSRAVSLVKMALGANQISSLLGGGGSLLGSVGALTGGLNLMKGALPGIGGGQAAATGGSLISNALSGVSKLGALAVLLLNPLSNSNLAVC